MVQAGPVMPVSRWRAGWLVLALLLGTVALVSCAAPGGGPEAPCGQASAGFSHRQATVDGARLHYVIGGHGPAVLLLHGFPETWLAWRRVMPLLAHGHTVIAPDLRGIGCSSREPAGSGAGLPHLRSFMRPGAAQNLIKGHEREFLAGFIGSRQVVRSPVFDDYVAAYSRPGRASAALGQYRTLSEDAAVNRRRAGSPLPMSVLTTGGADGAPGPTAASARRVAPDVHDVVLEGAEHYVAEDQPAEFAMAIQHFLRVSRSGR